MRRQYSSVQAKPAGSSHTGSSHTNAETPPWAEDGYWESLLAEEEYDEKPPLAPLLQEAQPVSVWRGPSFGMPFHFWSMSFIILPSLRKAPLLWRIGKSRCISRWAFIIGKYWVFLPCRSFIFTGHTGSTASTSPGRLLSFRIPRR